MRLDISAENIANLNSTLKNLFYNVQYSTNAIRYQHVDQSSVYNNTSNKYWKTFRNNVHKKYTKELVKIQKYTSYLNKNSTSRD